MSARGGKSSSTDKGTSSKVTGGKTNGSSKHDNKIGDDRETLPSAATFHLPFDSSHSGIDRYELWTVRLPATVNLVDLEGCQLQLDSKTNGAAGPLASTIASASSNNNNNTFDSHDGILYSFQWGNKVENESFRVLVPQKTVENGDDDSESENESVPKNGELLFVPATTPFVRHLNVTQALAVTESERAPCRDGGPPAKDPVRHAYAHVPQKTGLKRRWKPVGGGATLNSGPNGIDADMTEPKSPDLLLTSTSPSRRKVETKSISSVHGNVRSTESNSTGNEKMETSNAKRKRDEDTLKDIEPFHVSNDAEVETDISKEERRSDKKAKKNAKKEKHDKKRESRTK